MKNKGFTLIELLAVIVILAIIALIATPIILNIIDNTKKSAIDRSKEMYLDAVEQAIARKNLASSFNPTTCTVKSDGNLICDIGDLELEFKGQKPNEGGILEIKDGKIIADTLVFGKENLDNSGDNGATDKTYNDGTGAIVDLMEGMTPIKHDGSNWIVASTNQKWYDYTSQEWANAIILKSGVTKNVGDILDIENDVKAMFVYIPRYEYKIDGTYGKNGYFNFSPGEIEMNFISKEITTASEDYRIHPAFTFGTEELDGIWVGKFETSTDKNSTCYITPKDTNCSNKNQDPYIVPNVISLKYQNVNNQFITAQKFNNYVTDGDSHIIKNSEWGAVAYLSQSKYGKYANSMYTSANREIYQNKSYTTGYSNGIPSSSTTNTQCPYDDIVDRGNGTGSCGGGASTTGNITGIYDMSGGAFDVVMGVYNGKMSSNAFASGFKTLPDRKYYDNYSISNMATACSGKVCYGHALSETSGWYGDKVEIISSDYPWMVRGGLYSAGADGGIFSSFYAYNGYGYYFAFRVAISHINQ